MVNKYEFILKYVDRLSHILQEELPEEELTLQEMVDKADGIIRNLFKL